MYNNLSWKCHFKAYTQKVEPTVNRLKRGCFVGQKGKPFQRWRKLLHFEKKIKYYFSEIVLNKTRKVH